MWKTLYEQPGGDMAVNTWGVMITAAFAAAAYVVHHRTKKVGINPDWMVWLYVIAITAGLAGARLLHFTMATPKEFFEDPMIYFRISQGGFALLGGVILAGIGGVIFALYRGIDPMKMCDAVMPAVLLGVAIGRVGCFFAGCCHGSIAPLPDNAIALFPASFSGGQLWLVPGPPFLLEMTNDGVGENHVIVLATQLYEVAATLAIFLSMSWLWRRRRFDGQVFGTTLMLYGLWRPLNETLRGDDVRGTEWFGFLSTSQVMSIPVFLIGWVIVLVKFRSGVKPARPFEPPDDDLVSGSTTTT